MRCSAHRHVEARYWAYNDADRVMIVMMCLGCTERARDLGLSDEEIWSLPEKKPAVGGTA